MTARPTLAPLAGRGRRALRAAGERLSGLSSCIGVLGTRVACFCVEADEEFSGERDTNDHFFLSGCEQPVTEVSQAFVVASSGGGDQEQDRADTGAAAADRPLASSLATVIGDWGDTYELGNGLVGVGAISGRSAASQATVRSATPLI